jgi:hypothetical protein
MAAASAATGFRTWMQTHPVPWLTPKRIRNLTIAAMVAAGLVSTVTVSGSSIPSHQLSSSAHAASAQSSVRALATGDSR